MPAEFDFIEWIKAQQRPAGNVETSVGDDLAVLRWEKKDLLLVGVDQVLDGVHFDSSIHSPREIGRKAMNRNLSDCAAMACLPAAAVTTLALPRDVGVDYAKEIFQGMKEAGEAFNCPIVGGDTGSWPGKLVVTVTILGRSDGIQPITRSGAKFGDSIYVTGSLGGSISGRHMTFTPRIELARKLAKEYRITSMIDLSDGLSRDIRQICDASHVHAMIFAEDVPEHPDAIGMDSIDSLEHALHDGEDYELLFTSPDHLIGFRDQSLGVFRIGEIRTVSGCTPVALVTEEDGIPLIPKGWEHTL